MSQGQTHDTTRYVLEKAPTDVKPRDIVTDGDVFGFAAAAAKKGQRLVLQIAGGMYNEVAVVPGEAWKAGQRLYYLEAADVITRQPQDWYLGIAAEDRDPTDDGGEVLLLHPVRDPNLITTIDFAVHEDLGADDDIVLRDFTGIGDGKRMVTGLVLYHDGALTPATATIALGDGTDNNDQLLAATPLGDLEAGGRHTVALSAPVPLDKIVLGIASGPITAGVLKITAELMDVTIPAE